MEKRIAPDIIIALPQNTFKDRELYQKSVRANFAHASDDFGFYTIGLPNVMDF